jgi:hypothetical protein
MSSIPFSTFLGRARIAIGALFLLASNVIGHAQSCAVCYTQAASSGHRFIHGLRTGILILIIPPMFMSVAITVLAYKKRNRTNDTEGSQHTNDW